MNVRIVSPAGKGAVGLHPAGVISSRADLARVNVPAGGVA